MKQSRITATSFAAVLSPLVGLAASLAGALPAVGADVPFTEHVISTTAIGGTSVFATDLDGDGDTDVLSASESGNKIAWYENDAPTDRRPDGSPPTFTEHVISTNAAVAACVFATDVDGDGDTDVLSASWLDNKIAWYESDGGSPPTFTERVISNNAWGAGSVFATDVDGDGDTDVLSASGRDRKIAWYESDGGSPPAFTERVISNNALGAGSVFATDVDGDGDIDVLSASHLDDKIAWYESDGGSPPTFTERVISRTADGAFSVFATDVDGDGDTDVLSASWNGHKIAWYESDGGSPPSFTERVISTTTGRAASVFATDVDADGDTDVLSASNRDHKIAWYESDGGSPPTFTERVISNSADGAASVFATDVDGDGDTDVLSASALEIAWYENMTPIVAGLDIKPGSCPNPVNTRSRGVVPMAIVGGKSFDVTQIDVNSLTLARADGVGGVVTPLTGPPGPGITIEDTATPFPGDLCDCHDLTGDGMDDLSLKFSTEDMVAALELGGMPNRTEVQLRVSGLLLDQTPFEGNDCVLLLTPNPGQGDSAVDADVDADTSSDESAEEQEETASAATELDAEEPVEELLTEPMAGCGILSPALALMTLGGVFLSRLGRGAARRRY